MKIIIRNRKGGGKRAGMIYSTNLSEYCKMEISYSKFPSFFKELQDLLLIYWDLEVISDMKIKNKLLSREVKQNYKKARGSVTRQWRRYRRGKEDEEYRKRCNMRANAWHKENLERDRERNKKITKTLNEFADKHCSICGKLLNYRTKGKLCKECRISNLLTLKIRKKKK